MANAYRIQLSLTCRIDGALYNSIDRWSFGVDQAYFRRRASAATKPIPASSMA
jgi:hypothetical protein